MVETAKKNDIKRFYVSGRISGMKIEYAKQNFHFACKEVKKYHEADIVVNPFDIKPFMGINNWLCYMINAFELYGNAPTLLFNKTGWKVVELLLSIFSQNLFLNNK